MKQRINHYMYLIFLFLRKNRISKRYIERLYHRFVILKTEDEYNIGIYVMKLFLVIAIVWGLLLGFLIGVKGIKIENFIMVLSFLFIISNHIIVTGIEEEEKKLLRQFEKYIGGLRHSFHEFGVVEEAISDSLENINHEIYLHIEKIYQILLEDDPYEVCKYKEIAPNQFFLTFLALCQITISYGDTIYLKQSLFLSNLNHLKNEINMELLKRDKIKHVFSGLIFITLMPVFFLNVIKDWSISNLPELSTYYHGGFGIVISILIYLFTLMSYYLICSLKENHQFQRREHPILESISQWKGIKNYIISWCRIHIKKAKQMDQLLKAVGNGLELHHYVIQKKILFWSILIAMQCIICSILSISKWNIIYDTGSFTGITFSDKEKEVGEYKTVITKFTEKYEKIQWEPQKKGQERQQILKEEIRQEYEKFNDAAIVKLAEEIDNRVKDCEKYFYRGHFILISILVAVLASYVPELVLRMKKAFQRMSMEDEVMQFQTVIIMLMHLPRTDVITILEWLENISRIFKNSIIECIDYYFYDEEESLEILKEKEPFLPLVRIIENLEICDKVGVQRAFAEMEGERTYYLEKRKQDNEIMISNKGVMGKAAAYIPLITTLGLYLIVPFVLESIARLMTYIAELNGV